MLCWADVDVTGKSFDIRVCLAYSVGYLFESDCGSSSSFDRFEVYWLGNKLCMS